MTRKILTICVPTYNRKDLVVNDAKRYLSVNDDRYLVKYVDNASQDGTSDALENYNDNPKFKLVRNEKNIFNMPNMVKSLSDNETEYSLLVLDKDFLNLDLLSDFIDFLEQYEPDFGFVDPACGYKEEVSNTKRVNCFFEPGIDSIYKMAYLSKHPSGYFYKSKIFEEAKNSVFYKDVDPLFDFPFELMNSYLSLKYKSVIVKWPFIIRAAKRGCDDKSKTYSAGNLYFELPRRKMYYKEYLLNAAKLSIDVKEKRKLFYYLTKRALVEVTTVLAGYWKDKNSCYHYHIEPRVVPISEMWNNSSEILAVFRKFQKETHWKLSFKQILSLDLFRIRLMIREIRTRIKTK